MSYTIFHTIEERRGGVWERRRKRKRIEIHCVLWRDMDVYSYR
jgi:hypothetical protein